MAESVIDPGLEAYKETALAFEQIIGQIGEGIVRAQSRLDKTTIEMRRQVLAALQDEAVKAITVPSLSAYSISDTELDIKVRLSMKSGGVSQDKQILVAPINAKNSADVEKNIDSMTSIHLKFAPVPPAEETPWLAPRVLSVQEARAVADNDLSVKQLLQQPGITDVTHHFCEECGCWAIAYIREQKPRILALVHDQTAQLLAVVPWEEQFDPASVPERIDKPKVTAISPQEGHAGDVITLTGDNLRTLSGETEVTVDGRRVMPLNVLLSSISFRIPPWCTEGSVTVRTLKGSIEPVSFNPIPTIDSFSPTTGTFDPARGRGTVIHVRGSNFLRGCVFKFTPEIVSERVTILTPQRCKVEVPQGAQSGTLSVTYLEKESIAPGILAIQPGIAQIQPQQGAPGEKVTISGSSLDRVSSIIFGDIVVEQFVLHAEHEIQFLVPHNAVDARLTLREMLEDGTVNDVQTKETFLVIPQISRFGETIVSPGAVLRIYADGLDRDQSSMAVMFASPTGEVAAPVNAISSDRSYVTTAVPKTAVTGFVRIIRKKVYSRRMIAATSRYSDNKIIVLKPGGVPEDVILAEWFDNAELADWSNPSNAFKVSDGALSASTEATLSYAGTMSTKTLYGYLDVLRAEHFGLSLVSDSAELKILLDCVTGRITGQTLENNADIKTESAEFSALVGAHHALAVIATGAGTNLYDVKVLLNQKTVFSTQWTASTITGFAIQSLSKNQYFDNVILAAKDVVTQQLPLAYTFNGIGELLDPATLRLDSFSPLTQSIAPDGTTVTLKGSGFSKTISVVLGGLKYPHVIVSDKILKVTIPATAIKGGTFVVSTSDGLSVASAKGFVLRPKITRVSSTSVKADDVLVIYGANFTTGMETVVTLYGKVLTLLRATPTYLQVTIPSDAVSGKLIVKCGTLSVTYVQTITVKKEELLFDLFTPNIWQKMKSKIFIESSQQWREQPMKAFFALYPPNFILEDGTQYYNGFSTPATAEPTIRQGFLFFMSGVAIANGTFTLPSLALPDGEILLYLSYGLLGKNDPYFGSRQPFPEGAVIELVFISADAAVLPILTSRKCNYDGRIDNVVLDLSKYKNQKGTIEFRIKAPVKLIPYYQLVITELKLVSIQ